MNNKQKIRFIIILFCFLIIISIFFSPELIKIYRIRQKVNLSKSKINNINIKKVEFIQKLDDIKYIIEILIKSKEEIVLKLKELIKINSFYGQEIEEGKSDYYLIERKNEIIKGSIKLYEKNNLNAYNIINKLQTFYKNDNLRDYYNDISNILLVSTIIENDSDINFIYNNIIPQFYGINQNVNKINTKLILGKPCFKAIFDSNDPYLFHKKCDGIGDTIMFIKTNKTRFGGITDLSWGKKYNRENEYNNTKTRLFNLDNHKIFIYNKNQKSSKYIPPIRGDNNYFAIFGYNDIYLGYLPWESSSVFPRQFLSSNNSNVRFNELLNEKLNPFLDEVRFEYLDIEVYPIILINNNQKE